VRRGVEHRIEAYGVYVPRSTRSVQRGEHAGAEGVAASSDASNATVAVRDV
jgi:hypothetical protein